MASCASQRLPKEPSGALNCNMHEGPNCTLHISSLTSWASSSFSYQSWGSDDDSSGSQAEQPPAASTCNVDEGDSPAVPETPSWLYRPPPACCVTALGASYSPAPKHPALPQPPPAFSHVERRAWLGTHLTTSMQAKCPGLTPPSPATQSAFLQGLTVFQEEGVLGAGTFGRVYRGASGGREVVVKVVCVLHDCPCTAAALEAEVLSQQMSPAAGLALGRCCVLLDGMLPGSARFEGLSGRDVSGADGRLCVEALLLFGDVMNGDLFTYMRKNRKVCLSDLLKVLRGAALGLAHMHASGYVHGDVKPSNMLTYGMRQGCMSDFGSTAKKGGKPATCTVDFCPPERFWLPESCSTAWDIYAFGFSLCMAFSCLADLRDCYTDQLLPSHMLDGTLHPPHDEAGWMAHATAAADCIHSMPGMDVKQAAILRQLALDCMAFVPASRPRAKDVAAKLQRIAWGAFW